MKSLKLSDVNYNFENDITEFCEENGFGKSTLAAFIKAMFYGLPSVRANAKEFNDRKHFYPFDGKKFGGYLTFEMSGKTYKITRYFDKKSEIADTLTVHCGSALCSDLGTDIGRTVFGVDKESFERTIFITSDAIDMCATKYAYNDMYFSDNAPPGNRVYHSSHDVYIEAIIAAIYKDKGFAYCKEWVISFFQKYGILFDKA